MYLCGYAHSGKHRFWKRPEASDLVGAEVTGNRKSPAPILGHLTLLTAGTSAHSHKSTQIQTNNFKTTSYLKMSSEIFESSYCSGEGNPFLEAHRTDLRFCFPTAYAVGMILTFVVLMVMKTGQPALLYLVPCTLITVSVVAWSRKEMKKFWEGSSYQVCACTL